ncbi:MAG: hypothetical protein M3Y77_05770 [Actinomycetota bacterium]|nr:hypothetical protein [Actinomycetota bacterium]
MVYEVVTFQALREQLRCKEIWVVGSDSWRNPDDDLPADFEQRRGQNYGELRKPLDPAVFIHDLRAEMAAALDGLNSAVTSLEWLDITDRASGAITLSKFEAAPEPRNLATDQGRGAAAVGNCRSDRHLEGSGVTYWLPGRGQRRRRQRHPAGGGAR